MFHFYYDKPNKPAVAPHLVPIRQTALKPSWQEFPVVPNFEYIQRDYDGGALVVKSNSHLTRNLSALIKTR